jgi:hypothetical protein
MIVSTCRFLLRRAYDTSNGSRACLCSPISLSESVSSPSYFQRQTILSMLFILETVVFLWISHLSISHVQKPDFLLGSSRKTYQKFLRLLYAQFHHKLTRPEQRLSISLAHRCDAIRSHCCSFRYFHCCFPVLAPPGKQDRVQDVCLLPFNYRRISLTACSLISTDTIVSKLVVYAINRCLLTSYVSRICTD